MTQRNRHYLVTRSQVQAAVRLVYANAKTLHLSCEDWHHMLDTDILQYTADPELLTYAAGLIDAFEIAIRDDLCEFKYLVGSDRLDPREYVVLDEAARKGAHFVLSWKGTEQAFFGPTPAEFTGAL